MKHLTRQELAGDQRCRGVSDLGSTNGYGGPTF